MCLGTGIGLLLNTQPILFLMFFFNNLDRSNLGNAKAAGMTADLNMNSEQYSVALLVFVRTTQRCSASNC